MAFSRLIERIVVTRKRTQRSCACVVGLSGIDASGKGHVARRLTDKLETLGHRVALINVDGWLKLPAIRFLSSDGVRSRGEIVSDETPEGTHFYLHAFRLDEMFERLILPLKLKRSVDLTMDFAEETSTEFRPHNYLFRDVDIVLLEGIFIFKREFVRHFDLRVWIECGFETALRRAVTRSQEDLSPDETVLAYKTIYFPAQRMHFQTDDPRAAADIVYLNE